jgi:CBS domain-containing protein
MQQTTSLSKPVGSIMRPIPRVWTSASVAAAAAEIRDSGLPAVAVTEGFLYVAIVTQSSLAAAQARGVGAEDSVEKVYDANAVTLPPYAPGEKALAIFSSQAVSAIPVVDDYGRLMGVLTPADLWPKRDKAPRPPAVGGMATPFGVYLTTGAFGAGAGGFALVTTGMLMFTALTFCGNIADMASNYGGSHGWPYPSFFALLLSAVLFRTAFRLSPISGIHAAEHKVVHAIERGEELTTENVRRMPRVHPRCGTNFASGAMIFLTISSFAFTDEKSGLDKDGGKTAIVLAALICTLLFWRVVGSWMQYWVTTKEPSDDQIQMGIKSGEDLLKKYAVSRGGQRGVLGRIWNSGMIHVIAGASIVYGLFALADVLFKIHLVS